MSEKYNLEKKPKKFKRKAKKYKIGSMTVKRAKEMNDK